jgi:hypothetical protein
MRGFTFDNGLTNTWEWSIWARPQGRGRQTGRYSIFGSALYRHLGAKWRFPQEKATLLDLKMATSESKML